MACSSATTSPAPPATRSTPSSPPPATTCVCCSPGSGCFALGSWRRSEAISAAATYGSRPPCPQPLRSTPSGERKRLGEALFHGRLAVPQDVGCHVRAEPTGLGDAGEEAGEAAHPAV